jgi:hypothetical protein
MPTIPVIPTPFNNPAIQMVVGKERQFQFQVTDRNTNAVVDVTAWTNFRFMAKVNPGDTDIAAVINKSLGSGITKLTPTQGLLQVSLVAADTSALVDIRQSLFAEIQGIDAAALVWSLWQGGLDLLPTAVQASN